MSLYALVLALSATVVADSGVESESRQPCERLPQVVLAAPGAIVDHTVAGLQRLPSGSRERASEKQYRAEAAVFVRANGLGFVNDVTFAQSTGNRRVDMAIAAWVHGYKFEERGCGGARDYVFRMDIDLNAPGAN